MLQDYYYNEVPATVPPSCWYFLAERGIGMAAATLQFAGPCDKGLRGWDCSNILPRSSPTGEIGVSKHKPDIYRMVAERLGTAPVRDSGV